MAVYFIASESGKVKIGHTAGDVRRRLRNLQTGSAERLTLLYVAKEGGKMMETDLHRRFSADRLAGEWFTLTSAINEYILQLKGIPYRERQKAMRKLRGERIVEALFAKNSLKALMSIPD